MGLIFEGLEVTSERADVFLRMFEVMSQLQNSPLSLGTVNDSMVIGVSEIEVFGSGCGALKTLKSFCFYPGSEVIHSFVRALGDLKKLDQLQ